MLKLHWQKLKLFVCVDHDGWMFGRMIKSEKVTCIYILFILIYLTFVAMRRWQACFALRHCKYINITLISPASIPSKHIQSILGLCSPTFFFSSFDLICLKYWIIYFVHKFFCITFFFTLDSHYLRFENIICWHYFPCHGIWSNYACDLWQVLHSKL